MGETACPLREVKSPDLRFLPALTVAEFVEPLCFSVDLKVRYGVSVLLTRLTDVVEVEERVGAGIEVNCLDA